MVWARSRTSLNGMSPPLHFVWTRSVIFVCGSSAVAGRVASTSAIKAVAIDLWDLIPQYNPTYSSPTGVQRGNGLPLGHRGGGENLRTRRVSRVCVQQSATKPIWGARCRVSSCETAAWSGSCPVARRLRWRLPDSRQVPGPRRHSGKDGCAIFPDLPPFQQDCHERLWRVNCYMAGMNCYTML